MRLSEEFLESVSDHPTSIKWRERVASISSQDERYEMIQFTYDTVQMVMAGAEAEFGFDREAAFEDGYADGFKAGIKHATRVWKNGGLDPNRPDPYTDIARQPKATRAEIMENLTYDTPGVIK